MHASKYLYSNCYNIIIQYFIQHLCIIFTGKYIVIVVVVNKTFHT